MVTETHHKAEIAMLKVQQRALEKGIICSKPVVEGTRYDLIIDDGSGKLQRAQVKYTDCSVQSDNAAHVKLINYQGAARCYTAEEVDMLLVYLPTTDTIYCIPHTMFCGKTEISLRFKAAANGQRKGVIMAGDFKW